MTMEMEFAACDHPQVLRLVLFAWLVTLGVSSVGFVALVLCQNILCGLLGIVRGLPRRADEPVAVPKQRSADREPEHSLA